MVGEMVSFAVGVIFAAIGSGIAVNSWGKRMSTLLVEKDKMIEHYHEHYIDALVVIDQLIELLSQHGVEITLDVTSAH